MYQIWQDPQTEVCGLFGGLLEDERQALESTGLKMIRQLDTDDEKEAQQLFVDWCHEQCPDAKVQRADVQGMFERLVLQGDDLPKPRTAR